MDAGRDQRVNVDALRRRRYAASRSGPDLGLRALMAHAAVMPAPRQFVAPGSSGVRRNRNIGTARSGHGKSNAMVIPFPRSHENRMFAEVLDRSVRVVCSVQDDIPIQFFVEPPTRGYHHACTVDDVVQQLRNMLPWRSDWEGIDTVLLRQPTRKQEILSSAWGRLIPRGKNRAAICLEAQCVDARLRWPRSLDPDGMRELDRLRVDGHHVLLGRREYVITFSLDSVRATQLYRTLIHEIGHHVDKRRSTQRAYEARPWAEREAFAHRYALNIQSLLRRTGKIPFASRRSAAEFRRYGLNPDWFGQSREQRDQCRGSQVR